MTDSIRIAVIHDWLVTYAGAERVLERILLCYPTAELFSVIDFLPTSQRHFLHGKQPRTTFIQKLPFSKRMHRHYIWLMPVAIEQIDLSTFDLVLSSSYAVAKGVITGPDQLHISYVHSPMRYAWDLQHQYLREARLSRGLRSLAARWMLHRLRLWDSRTACGVDHFIANSKFIARRIRKAYRREASVIYPPVDVSTFSMGDRSGHFYFTASRLVPYKRVELLVEAFALLPDRELLVAGEGPEFKRIAAKAPPNVRMLGYQPAERLVQHMQQARAFVFAAEEDFGIVPLEAQACGTPVVALRRGGLAETIRGLESASPTGVFFQVQTPAAIAEGIRQFEAARERIKPEECRENALRFSAERFDREFTDFVDAKWAEFSDGLRYTK